MGIKHPEQMLSIKKKKKMMSYHFPTPKMGSFLQIYVQESGVWQTHTHTHTHTPTRTHKTMRIC